MTDGAGFHEEHYEPQPQDNKGHSSRFWDFVVDPPNNVQLPYVDLTLDPIPPRQWLVPGRIPGRNVTLLSGEGAVGKSIVLMQLSAATVLGRDWIGTLPERGAVLYVSCEEDEDEVRRRSEAIATYFGFSRSDLVEHGLRVLSFAGKDAVMGYADRDDRIQPTPLFKQLRHDAIKLRPKLIVLDNAADVFAGKENDRAQTRQFITLLRALAIEADGAVVLSAHPSLTGISNDTGLSGNTQWHNGPRARMYLKRAEGDDSELRVLEVKKNNYGAINETILLRWHDGVYVPEPGAGSLEKMAAEQAMEHLFLKLLRRFAEQGRNVTDKVSPSYAPSVFASEPEAKESGVRKKAFAEAMVRLFATGKICVISFGPPSKMRTKIVEAERSSNDRSNGIPTSSNGVSLHTPHTP